MDRGARALRPQLARSAFVIAVGHLLSTATFDLLAWTAFSWLLARALRCTDPVWGGPVWLTAGLVAGIGLLNKTLLAFYLAALVVALLVVGPRAALRSPWLWGGGAVALALWVPNLWWQATHGWPQLELSTAIAAGGSATSAPRWLFLPFQLVLASPFASVTPAARIDNSIGLDTEEQGRTVWICREQRGPWSQAWPQIRYVG